eukprot:gene17850-36507_t
MRPRTPSARSRCRTRVVLPAPRSPCSVRVAWAMAGERARRRAKAWVSSSVAQWPCHSEGADTDAAGAEGIQAWGQELAFSQIGVAGVDLSAAEPGLQAWLSAGCHGDMAYMAAHGLKRARPAELVPGTLSVLTARMNYLPRDTAQDWQEAEWQRLRNPGEAVVSVYARGRDYHKVLRNRLDTLAQQIDALLVDTLKPGGLAYRAFTDSAPVMEAELATRSGQGWRGKHSLVLNRE